MAWKRLSEFLVVVTLTLGISGCMGTGAVPIDVPIETTVAGNVDSVNTSVENTVTTITNQIPLEWFVITLGAIIFLAGWAIPKPSDMFSGIWGFVSLIFKGIGDFILKLLGRM